MRVLVTGGAGYVGSVLVGCLLERGHDVTVMDILRKGGLGLLPHFANPAMRFVRGDIRDAAAVEEAVKGADVIIHLAAVVGQPSCDKDPWTAKQVNLDGTANIIEKRSKRQLVVFASTLSNYGAVTDKICDETMEPKPLTLYAATKMTAERRLLESGNVIIFRPGTAFGVSPQMRLDLLFNDFVYRAVTQRSLVLYQEDFVRPFIHVRDFARGFLFGIENRERMVDQVYNLGDESLSVSKQQLADRIRQRADFTCETAGCGEDPDKRNYMVNFSKIKALGYSTSVSLDDGIDEVIRAIPVLESRNLFSNPSYY